MASDGKRRAESKRPDEALIVLLASGRDVRTAAKQAGMGERTAHRRLTDPEFRQRVTAARAQFYEEALGRLSRATTSAVETLVALLDADAETVRLGASRSILDLGMKLRESVALEQRVAELEGRANGQRLRFE